MSTPTWPKAPLPPDEAERLEALRSYQILDTPNEVAFDRLARIAARRFGMPIAIIAMLDKDRLWFKARYGIETNETPRDQTFCSYVILQDEVMVVNNILEHPLFSTNPLVVGEPHIRFYAGAPIKTQDGHKLGTVCVIDDIPHPNFSEEEIKDLSELASIALDEMELRLSMQRARDDLAALQEAQKSLENARKEAERTTREKSQFVATISHELRTPMNGILGMSYLLSETPLNAVQREYIDTINHSAQNLLLLINDVLDLSKIEAGELVLEKKRYDIRNHFIHTVKLLTPLANRRSNALRYHIDDSVPQTIIGDPGRFAQIVTNLVGNAVKFTEKGKVETTLYYDSESNSIHCEVADTGIGIPQSKREAIFEKFNQGDATITQKYGGTGLGLAITKHLVKMLGGTIGFDSEEHVGSRFWFSLPIPATEDQRPSRAGKPPIRSVVQRISAAAAHVLVAEDHHVNQLFMVALLKKFGFTKIDIAENGAEVLESLHRNAYGFEGNPYDAIFMDCKMPEMDGYETTRTIREQERIDQKGAHVPIVAMTANALAGDREDCFEAGMDEYLSKPLQPERLKEVLGQWFDLPTNDVQPLPSPTPKQSIPAMDFTRLQMVAETNAEKAALLDIFFKLTRDVLLTMEAARRAEEFDQWQNAAHKLKGAAANMGMAALENMCRESELAAELTYSQRSGLLRQMKDEVARIKAYIVTIEPTLLPPEVVT